MVFQFEHIGLQYQPGQPKWHYAKELDVPKLKEIFTKWQTELGEEEGWNSLFWNNHDLPRIVSTWGDDGDYRVKSAKALAILLHLMKGTPYIYQGEELGMTNIRFSSIGQYKDIDTLNHYAEAVTVFHEDPEHVMEAIYAKGRDNARTPMQWDASPNAGFTDAVPWIPVNPNYTEINAEAAIRDRESIYHYYQDLIRIRRNHKVVVYGDYNPVCEEHPSIYAYTRRYQGQKLLVVLNFFSDPAVIDLPKECLPENGIRLIGNYEDAPACEVHMKLRAFEAVVFLGGDEVEQITI